MMFKLRICAALFFMVHGGMVAANAAASEPAQQLSCDDSIKREFRPDNLTTVTLVKLFKRGDTLALSGGQGGGGMMLAMGPPAKAQGDLCLVKLLVGPGNPGPVGAPSTSPGIGMEIWLPSKSDWNERIHNMGGGAWVGGDGASPTTINWPYVIEKANIGHAVTSMQDTGHFVGNGSFAMLPDGTPNRRLWEDFAVRGLHEQAIKTRALARAFYGRPAKYAYFEGGSTGGRQAHKLAQVHPEDYDGLIGLFPAINWSPLLISKAHKAIVFERDLGGKSLTDGQQDMVSLAAINACDQVGGVHMGYILDQAACRYDPTKDAEVLCVTDGGKNATPDCVTRIEATVMNKIWYGPTTDGSVPDPTVDNGWNATLGAKQNWYGVPRGTLLTGSWYIRNLIKQSGGKGMPAMPRSAKESGSLGPDQLALALQNPTISDPSFKNATGDGQGLWRQLTPVQYINAVERANALDQVFANINTDNPDLSRFQARGGKFLGWHGTADETIPVQGTLHYYNRLLEKMGGVANVNSFYKMYLVPAAGHGSPVGAANGEANPPAVENHMYELLRAWVEKGVEPNRVEIRSLKPGPTAATHPLCPLPTVISYIGGNPLVASSFTCK